MRRESAGPAIRTENHGGILVVTLDQPGDAVNKVDRALGEELERVLQTIEHDKTIYAAVLTS
jgi:enoyl-CoA hydratase/carnithine racemase